MRLGVVWYKLSATYEGQSIFNKPIQVEVDSTVWDFKMWWLAVLMGDHINEGLLYENAWPFHRAKTKWL